MSRLPLRTRPRRAPAAGLESAVYRTARRSAGPVGVVVALGLASLPLAGCQPTTSATGEERGEIRVLRPGDAARIEIGRTPKPHRLVLEVVESGTYGLFGEDDLSVSATLLDANQLPVATVPSQQESRQAGAPILEVELAPGRHRLELVIQPEAAVSVVELTFKRTAVPGGSGAVAKPVTGRYPSVDSSGYPGEPLPVDPEDEGETEPPDGEGSEEAVSKKVEPVDGAGNLADVTDSRCAGNGKRRSTKNA